MDFFSFLVVYSIIALLILMKYDNCIKKYATSTTANGIKNKKVGLLIGLIIGYMIMIGLGVIFVLVVLYNTLLYTSVC